MPVTYPIFEADFVNQVYTFQGVACVFDDLFVPAPTLANVNYVDPPQTQLSASGLLIENYPTIPMFAGSSTTSSPALNLALANLAGPNGFIIEFVYATTVDTQELGDNVVWVLGNSYTDPDIQLWGLYQAGAQVGTSVSIITLENTSIALDAAQSPAVYDVVTYNSFDDNLLHASINGDPEVTSPGAGSINTPVILSIGPRANGGFGGTKGIYLKSMVMQYFVHPVAPTVKLVTNPFIVPVPHNQGLWR